MDLRLRPSDIRFTQNKIASEFRSGTRYENVKIGQTLDNLLMGYTKVADIPKISVCYRDGEWYSVDNRRLWIFQKLEKLGKCTHVPVKQSKFIPNKKFSTKNGGKTVILRRDPGGQHWRVEEELLEVKASLLRHFESHDSITSSKERPNESEEDRKAPRTQVVNDQQEKPLSTTTSSESSVTIKMSERVLTENLEGKSVSGKLPSDADKIERMQNETQGLDGDGGSLSGTLSRKSIKNTPGTALTSESREDVLALQQKSNNNINLKGKPLNTVPASNLEVAPLSTLLSNKSEEKNKIEHKTLDQKDVQAPKIVSSKKKKKKKEVKQTIAATNSVEIPTTMSGTNTKKEKLFLGVCPLLPIKSQSVQPVTYSNTHSIPTSKSPYCVQNGKERLQDIDFRLACLGLSRLCAGTSHYQCSSLLRSRAT